MGRVNLPLNPMTRRGLTAGMTGSADRHSSPAPSAGVWFQDTSGFNLTQALDFRQLDGGSTLSLDGNQGCYAATDLSGNGNDAVHWRASGNSELARVHVDGDALEIVGPTVERHWGQKLDGIANPSMANGYHIFTVIAVVNTFGGTGSSGAWDLPTGGVNTGPQLALTRHGAAVTTPSFPVLDVGGTQGNGTVRVHLGGLCGQLSDNTQPTLIPALVEFRTSALDFTMKAWVNGLEVGNRSNGGGGDSLTYAIWGKSDLNNQNSAFEAGTKLFAVAYGKTDGVGLGNFTEAQAALVRAAMLADFGIEVWDGVTYP